MTPDALEAESQKALALHREGRLVEAESVHRFTVQSDPANGYFKYRLAETLISKGGDPDEIIDLVMGAARLDPHFPLFRDTALRLLFQRRPPAEALEAYLSLDAPCDPPASASSKLSTDKLAAILLLEHKKVELCWNLLRHVFGSRAKSILIDDRLSGAESVFLNFDASGYEIALPGNFSHRRFLIERLFAMQGAFDHTELNGTVKLSLGDGADGDDDQLCFSSRTAHQLPVPDAVFFNSDGYAAQREAFATAPDWTLRPPIAYWRGSLTGNASNWREVFALPRVQICLAARFTPTIDARITDLSQFAAAYPELEEALTGLDLLGERRPETDNQNFRYGIDVDGNTNAWQSLYVKLLAGTCVLKIASPYRQWHYDRIRDGETVRLVAGPRDLSEALLWAEANPTAAKEIAQRGRELALSMTVASEREVFARTAHLLLAR